MRAPALVSVAALALAGRTAERATTPTLVIPADAPVEKVSYKRPGLTVSDGGVFDRIAASLSVTGRPR